MRAFVWSLQMNIDEILAVSELSDGGISLAFKIGVQGSCSAFYIYRRKSCTDGDAFDQIHRTDSRTGQLISVIKRKITAVSFPCPQIHRELAGLSPPLDSRLVDRMIFQDIVTLFHHSCDKFTALAFWQMIAHSLLQHVVRRCQFIVCSTIVYDHAVSVAGSRIKLEAFHQQKPR